MGLLGVSDGSVKDPSGAQAWILMMKSGKAGNHGVWPGGQIGADFVLVPGGASRSVGD